MPRLLLAHSYASASVVTNVLLMKYVDAMPLYRQEQSNRSIIPRYRTVVIPGTHTAENHDFISSDQRGQIINRRVSALRCALR